VLAGILFISNR